MGIKQSSIAPIEIPDASAWLDLYGDYLFRHAMLRVGRRAIAEELVQDTFVSALQAINSFEGKASIKTWLLTILKNKTIDHFRKFSREQIFDPNSEGSDNPKEHFNSFGIWRHFIPNWQDNPEVVLEQKGFLNALESCLRNLPSTARQVLVMKSVDGVETSEICQALDISASNVWVLMHRARLKLRDCLDLNWFKTKQKGIKG